MHFVLSLALATLLAAPAAGADGSEELFPVVGTLPSGARVVPYGPGVESGLRADASGLKEVPRIPLPGGATLLVRLPGVRGDLLFGHGAPSSGFTGDHRLVLPPDPALVGATATIQGMVGGASVQLCNRLDVTLGAYE